MKKYYMNVYFGGWKKVEVNARNEDEAYELAEEEVKKEVENSIELEELSVEAEYDYEEDLEDTCEYADLMLDEMRGN